MKKAISAIIGGSVFLLAAALAGKGVRKVAGYVAGKMVELDLVPIGNGHELRSDAAAAFLAMRAAAASAGIELVVNSAWRSLEAQQLLYEKYLAGKGALAAKPGYSNHQAGIDVDIESGNGSNAAYVWLTQNAAHFGFRRTVASEPWHWEYSA